MESILKGIEQSPGLAAWVQAVGSIVAIVAAFLVVYVNHWIDRRRQKAERHRLNAGLSSLVKSAIGLVERSTERAENSKGVIFDGMDDRPVMDALIRELERIPLDAIEPAAITPFALFRVHLGSARCTLDRMAREFWTSHKVIPMNEDEKIALAMARHFADRTLEELKPA